MIGNWLSETKRVKSKYKKFNIYDLTEDENKRDENLEKYLAEQMFIHLGYPNKMKRIYGNQDSSILKEHIYKKYLPPEGANLKQSTWAEIVAADILEKIKSHILPIYKLRFRDKNNMAMRGEADIVSCKIEGEKPTLIFTEVKSRRTYKKKVGVEAYEGVVKNNKENPDIVNFVSNCLERENNYEFMELFDNALLDPKSYNKDFEIFIVIEKDVYKPDILDALHEEDINLPNLNLNLLLIDSMKDLFENTYKQVGTVAEDFVYDK
ncbi:MAG: DUF1837 domain-containing protein [Methanobrevibacter arboriphilus]|uniref:DUF1837 domain-containing protein n=1 Tax=Methanobrevibacter arboriphilus TaxID=39441 RepID=A0A843AFC9_METAZ|nr:Hachiman antiphage defense system protein HamA [Methanobrevibacter arboriphilus]MBF4468613.1 DUF1837 domain-containing protein [Methanobrevibacter arboriphilus]